VPSSLFLLAVFNPALGTDNTQKAHWLFQAGVTMIWCLSMVLLFSDIFLVKRASPGQVRRGEGGPSLSPVRERRDRRAGLGVRRVHHIPEPLDTTLQHRHLADMAGRALRGVGPDGYRDLHDQRAHAP
jgi:hypothetical protein